MLELWGRANAYNVQKVLWLLRELDLEFSHHEIGSQTGDLESAEFLALNPHARIPVLREAGCVIWESNTILRYLAARHGRAQIWSEDPAARSGAERWMDWELSKLQPDFIELFWSYYRTPAAQRDAVRIEAARGRCAAHMLMLDRQLDGNDYLTGDNLGLADICCGICLYRYFEMGLECERPRNLMRWYRNLRRREPYRQTVMTAFGELEGRLEF